MLQPMSVFLVPTIIGQTCYLVNCHRGNWNKLAFVELVELLLTTGVLKYFEFDKDFKVHTNTSSFAINGVVSGNKSL